MRHRTLQGLVIALACLASPECRGQVVKPSHGVSLYGSPKYPPDFRHFDYVNPDAPKGGSVRIGEVGSFDSLNQYIVKGNPANWLNLASDSLMVDTRDEPFSSYGLVAESIEVPEDRSWTTFNLRPEARFHDGTPITSDDVEFTLETLSRFGHPRIQSFARNIVAIEKLGAHRVRVVFRPGVNHELPVVIGLFNVLPKHHWAKRDFNTTTLVPPLGSGPYRIRKVIPGQSIEFERVRDYWAQHLPVRRGFHNFDSIRVDYYRDDDVEFEAFRSGQTDFHLETDSRRWFSGYNFPAVRDGRVSRVEIQHQHVQGMLAFAFNIRRFPFDDVRVRRAIALAFDFEWTNAVLFHGWYSRSQSYFANSTYSAVGPPSAEELKVLSSFESDLPPQILSRPYGLPVNDGSGHLSRENIRSALQLLSESGWALTDGVQTNSRGQRLEFEILLRSPGDERFTLPFARNLRRLGIIAHVRTIDSALAHKLEETFYFNVMKVLIPQYPTPGNEQRDYWHSTSASLRGGGNVIGIQDKTVDTLVDLIISASNYEELTYRTRALDRVLLWNSYVVPLMYNSKWSLAFWNRLGRPRNPPPFYEVGFVDTWWADPQ